MVLNLCELLFNWRRICTDKPSVSYESLNLVNWIQRIKFLSSLLKFKALPSILQEEADQ